MSDGTDDYAARVGARARLSLRAEKAFGAGAVRHFARPQAAESPPLAASQRNIEPEPEAKTVTLFGEVADAKGKVLETPNDQPFESPPPPTGEKIRSLQVLDDTEVKGCTRCGLSETRQNTVFGEGSPDARIFFIGEGPGQNEDETGRPFVGRAGELLDKMIVAMGLSRGEVYIANVVKCRPPGNRQPAAAEVEACTPYLVKQLDWIRPAAIVTLGLPATHFLLGGKLPMGKLRGRWHEWRGIKLMPTYHPAYVLRTPTKQVKGMVWGDLQMVMAELGLKPPGRGKEIPS